MHSDRVKNIEKGEGDNNKKTILEKEYGKRNKGV